MNGYMCVFKMCVRFFSMFIHYILKYFSNDVHSQVWKKDRSEISLYPTFIYLFLHNFLKLTPQNLAIFFISFLCLFPGVFFLKMFIQA